MEQVYQSGCERCNDPLCLGSFFHDWVDNDDNLLQVLPESYSESNMPTDQAAPVNDDGGVSSDPPNDENQAPSPKRGRFHNATVTKN